MNSNGQTTGTEPRWYCVRAQTRREHIAAAQLLRQGSLEVFCPRIRFRRRTRRGKVWFEEALFPGYLFARFCPEQSLRAVASAVGVRGVVRFGENLLPVPDGVISALRHETLSAPVLIPDEEFKPGDAAVLAEGPMMGLQALVTRVLPGGERVRILMEMMGTAVEVDVSADALERVA